MFFLGLGFYARIPLPHAAIKAQLGAGGSAPPGAGCLVRARSTCWQSQSGTPAEAPWAPVTGLWKPGPLPCPLVSAFWVPGSGRKPLVWGLAQGPMSWAHYAVLSVF